MVEPHQTHKKTFLRSLFPQQHGSSSMFSKMLLQQLNSDLIRCVVCGTTGTGYIKHWQNYHSNLTLQQMPNKSEPAAK